MKKGTFFIFVLCATFFALAAFQVTFALFSKTATSTNNTFTASANFPTATPTPPVFHVVINEVFHNGGNTGSNWKDQWIEIYNQSSSPINVSGWTISNASGSNIIPSVTPIPANGFGVIRGDLTTNGFPSIPGSAITITLSSNKIGSNGLESAGDFVKLLNGTTVVDQMSYGTNTTVFPTPPAAPSSTTSVSRRPNGVDTDTAADWTTNTTTSIGVSNP